MIGAGESIKEIADKLCLSAKTVEAHREHIKDKLGLKTSAQLMRFAIMNSPEGQQSQPQSQPQEAQKPQTKPRTKR
jgi:hypothetical protein